VTDFGISKPWRLENKNDTSGTASYMAPEVLTGRDYSFEVDFYALGIIMYECIVG
jgi:serine/threonine protein kinase